MLSASLRRSVPLIRHFFQLRPISINHKRQLLKSLRSFPERQPARHLRVRGNHAEPEIVTDEPLKRRIDYIMERVVDVEKKVLYTQICGFVAFGMTMVNISVLSVTEHRIAELFGKIMGIQKKIFEISTGGLRVSPPETTTAACNGNEHN